MEVLQNGRNVHVGTESNRKALDVLERYGHAADSMAVDRRSKGKGADVRLTYHSETRAEDYCRLMIRRYDAEPRGTVALTS